MFLYVNGEIKQDTEVHISPYEHGFLYGAGLFETFRTYGGHPFLFTDHMSRLIEGARELQMELPSSLEEEVRQAIPKLLEVNGLTDAYFRLNVSAGAEGVGLPAGPYQRPLVLLYIKELPAVVRTEKKGQTLSLRRNTPEGAVRRKSHHYLNNILAKREIGNHPEIEGIFLTESGAVSEGITSNIFFVKNGDLFTPSESCGCLNGITSQFVQHAAVNLGMDVYQGAFPLGKAQRADEIFLTNSIQEIVALTDWDEYHYPGASGAVTEALRDVYQQAVWKS